MWGLSRIEAHFRSRAGLSILQADIKIGPMFCSEGGREIT